MERDSDSLQTASLNTWLHTQEWRELPLLKSFSSTAVLLCDAIKAGLTLSGSIENIFALGFEAGIGSITKSPEV